MVDRKVFLEKGVNSLEKIYDTIKNSKEMELSELKGENSAIVIMDMVNGFIREGALSSKRVERIIPYVKDIAKKMKEKGSKVLAFRDCHLEDSVEFIDYPVHCVKDTSEVEIIDELKSIDFDVIIDKNSVNGFVEEKFQTWLHENDEINNFLIVGDCTDICVMNFALTLKCYFNSKDINSRIIVPIDGVETFDSEEHNGDFMNLNSLFIMKNNGIEIVYLK